MYSNVYWQNHNAHINKHIQVQNLGHDPYPYSRKENKDKQETEDTSSKKVGILDNFSASNGSSKETDDSDNKGCR